ncbi:hypothetical protein C8R46DRAFT_275950 [Mycena filopes]|nr:hypothetical protein C8R46DRAFT_275950 [Mycena filopes]
MQSLHRSGDLARGQDLGPIMPTLSIVDLPIEIVCEIFIQFLPKYPRCPPLTGSDSPIILTHICRQWREIAVATPSLWRAISVAESVSDADDAGRVEIMDMWLKRSNRRPLSLQFEKRDPSPPTLSTVFALAVSHSSRWEYVGLDVPPADLETILGPLPLLQQLDLALNVPTAFPLPGLEMPLLRTVILDLNYDITLEAGIMLPWAQLTSLTIHNATSRECISLLLETSNLVHCTLNVISDSISELQLGVTLPSLESLTLRTALFDSVSTVSLLAVLIIPSLHTLRLPKKSLGLTPIPTLTAFISKSGCKLEELVITGTRTLTSQTSQADAYREAFHSIPKIFFP